MSAGRAVLRTLYAQNDVKMKYLKRESGWRVSQPAADVHLDEDRSKREDATDEDDHVRFEEPFLLRNRSRNGVLSAGVFGLAADISAQHRTHGRQREDNKQADRRDAQLKIREANRSLASTAPQTITVNGMERDDP